MAIFFILDVLFIVKVERGKTVGTKRPRQQADDKDYRRMKEEAVLISACAVVAVPDSRAQYNSVFTSQPQKSNKYSN
ncbi:MAG: hypothetical protein LPD71_07045 [Shewanella sp.]|nr:hypothetical protein [Shewanella sp.]MCF1438498.1 hypothetical protein [Shewanella sp.]MCF1457104.1 hypothetical protein [Shewanella sp.]